MKILLISGSRTIKNRDSITKVIDTFMSQHGEEITHLITGGAIGVDAISEQIFLEKYGSLAILPNLTPNYARYGRQAPLIRNQDLVDKADIILAIWDGVSRGTIHTVNLGRKKGIPCYVVNIHDKDFSTG